MPNPTSKNQVSVDRRRFLTTFALGAAAAPILSLGRSVLAGSTTPQAPSLCYSSKRVLGPGDLVYLGAMRVPAAGTDMAFSYGTLTGRKVNGQVRLLMAGNVTKGDPIYEFADTGAYNTNPTLAPRMSLVRAWGDVYGNSRRTWYASGVEKIGYPRYPGALYWSETAQLLYWTYFDTYNTTGDEDWCLGASRLDPAGAAAFGPWRPAGGGKKGPWRCTRLAESPAGEFLCGSGVMSGNASSPWGPDLWAGQFPTAATPAGFGAPDLPISKYVTYYSMFGSVKPDGSFSGALRSARRPGTYYFEPINGSPVYTEIDPQKNGGVGSWTQVDSLSGTSWIDLPDVHGVLFTGKLATGHVWYRNAGVGNDLCTHGVASPVSITGPVSTDAHPVMIIYDPADLYAVRAGSRVDYTINPVHTINAESSYGVQTSLITHIGSAKTLGGTYFDAVNRKLYVSAPESDTTIAGVFNPLVHVFHIP